MDGALRKPGTRLAPEVSRIVLVKNLSYNITAAEIYDVFGKYGAIRQVRIGTAKDTKGTAFVVYEDIFDAKNACEHLNGFNVLGRYLVVLYYQPTKQFEKMDIQSKREELDKVRSKYGISKDD